MSLFNKPAGVWFIVTQQSIGEMSMVNLVTCLHFFDMFEALNDDFKVHIFQGFIFTPYQRYTDSM